MKKKIIGLTGGIASGKSVVSDVFWSLGALVIDADVVSREITQKGSPVLAEIENAFPGTVKEGELDRIALKKLAFKDENSTEKLNSITHPVIFNRIKQQIDKAISNTVILVVPLLYETGADKMCDEVIALSCSERLRIERLMKRDNINEELALNIISRQLTDLERSKRADYVINNDGDLELLRQKAEELYEKIKA